MQTPPSTHAADALALLLRQRDLQPYLDAQDCQNVALTSKQLRAATVPAVVHSTARRYADLLTAQFEARVPRRPQVSRALLATLVERAGDGPVDVRPLEDCRDLIWQADAAVRGEVRHTTQVLSSSRRREALALMYSAKIGCQMAEALGPIDASRRYDGVAMLTLAANDFSALSHAASGAALSYGAATTAHRAGQATVAWWGFGGKTGLIGASVCGVATGGLTLLSGGAALFAIDRLTQRAKNRTEEAAAAPYSVNKDLQLCTFVASRAQLRGP